MHKITCFISALLVLSCAENDNAQVKNDNAKNEKVSANDISCQICLIEKKYKELAADYATAIGNMENPKDLGFKTNLEKNKLDSLLLIFDSKEERDYDENLSLAYERCLDLHPFKITDSLKKEGLFIQYFAYNDRLRNFGFDMNIDFDMNTDLKEFIENLKNEPRHHHKENGSFRLIRAGYEVILSDEEELLEYLKKYKSNYPIAYDYIESKKNDVTKLLYNKSFQSLSEIEVLMLEYKIITHIFTHNLDGFSRKIIDEDEKFRELLNNLGPH